MPSLTAHQIKTIAIIAMLLDHIGWAFFDTFSFWGQILHLIGRITAPIMCFFIVQGYFHTHSFKKYFARLIIFGFISHVPYVYFINGEITIFPFSVMYTLALGLLAVYCLDRIKNEQSLTLALAFIVILSIPGDWMYIAIAFCAAFYLYRDDFTKQCRAIAIITIFMFIFQFLTKLIVGSSFLDALLGSGFQLGIVLCLPILKLYNGQRGGNALSKWMFYVFYPLHLLILGFLRYGGI